MAAGEGRKVVREMGSALVLKILIPCSAFSLPRRGTVAHILSNGALLVFRHPFTCPDGFPVLLHRVISATGYSATWPIHNMTLPSHLIAGPNAARPWSDGVSECQAAKPGVFVAASMLTESTNNNILLQPHRAPVWHKPERELSRSLMCMRVCIQCYYCHAAQGNR